MGAMRYMKMVECCHNGKRQISYGHEALWMYMQCILVGTPMQITAVTEMQVSRVLQ